MFDTMTMTKTVGALCGTLLVFLLGGWVAESIYHIGGGHGDDHAQGYMIEVASEEDAVEEDAAPEVPFEELFASASAADGEGVWRNCRSCHALEDGQNGVGPHLYGVVGRDVASVDGYGYSGALVEAAEVWTPENLNGFLEAPQDYAPGTAMGYAGLRDPMDRANLIAYLDSIGG